MQYKTGTPRNLREIGQQLGVAHVVEGSVQRAANKVRVNAQLLDRGPTRISGANLRSRSGRCLRHPKRNAKAIADQLQASSRLTRRSHRAAAHH